MAKQAAAAARHLINQIIVSIAVGTILWAVRQSAGGHYGAGDFITYLAALLHSRSAEDAVQRAGGHAARAHRGRKCLRVDRRAAQPDTGTPARVAASGPSM
jgi:hypothetical protein